jgi:hypothetical protein
MATVMAHDIGVELIQILGLQDKFVGSITIHIDPNAVVTMDVVHFMTSKQGEDILTMMKKYYLIEKSDGKSS